MSGDMEALYQSLILDHARSPEGRGDTAGWSPRSRQISPTCGDDITLALRLEDGRIAAVRWEGHGCAVSQASASLLSGIVAGRSGEEALGLAAELREVMRSRGRLQLDEERFGDAVALSGVSRYVGRVKCAMLAWVALEDALAEPAGTGSRLHDES